MLNHQAAGPARCPQRPVVIGKVPGTLREADPHRCGAAEKGAFAVFLWYDARWEDGIR